MGSSDDDTIRAGSSGVSLDGNDGYHSISNCDSASDVVSLKSGTAPTNFDKVKYNGSDYITSLGGADSIESYDEGNLVSVRGFKPADAAASVSGNNISLTFDNNNKLTFEGVADNSAVSLKSGRTT